jgi:hypothetical protein
VRLDDLWRAAKAGASKQPKHWRTNAIAKALIDELQKKVTTSYIKENKLIIPVIYAKAGRGNDGTFAHPIIAAAYAGYLSPKLEIEVREVWLRYRSGDATLADEILQARGLEPRVNVRDNLSTAELSFVMAAEALAEERIEQEIRLGNDECVEATAKSASAIREAIESDRKSRQARLTNR